MSGRLAPARLRLVRVLLLSQLPALSFAGLLGRPSQGRLIFRLRLAEPSGQLAHHLALPPAELLGRPSRGWLLLRLRLTEPSGQLTHPLALPPAELPGRPSRGWLLPRCSDSSLFRYMYGIYTQGTVPGTVAAALR